MRRSRTEPIWWTELSTGYLRSLGRRGRQPNTQRAYSCELLDFGEWLDRCHIETLSGLTRREIESWQDDLFRRKSPRTQQVAASAIRGLLKWAADQDLPLSSPALWLRVVRRRAPRLKPRPIPLGDLKLIWAYLGNIEGEPTLLFLRTRALFWVIFQSGARISEALSLDRASFADGVALVTLKGAEEHELMISRMAEVAVSDYLRARPDKGGALFVSYCRRPLTRLGKQEAQRGWNQLCRELGIARWTSHRIRHSCATELLRAGVDSLVITKHIGWRSPATIAGYAEVGLDTRRLAMQALDGRMARNKETTAQGAT